MCEHSGKRPDGALETLAAVQELRCVRDAYRAVALLLDSSTASVDPKSLAALMHELGKRFDANLATAEATARRT